MEQFSWLSEQGASLLVEYLQDGVYAIENEKMVYANPALCRLLGYSRQEIIGRPFIELIAPEDVELVLARHRDRVAGIHGPDCYTIRLRTSSGVSVTCELHVGLTVNREGRTVAVGSLRDVTEKMALQEQILATSEELSRIYEQLPDMYYRVDLDNVLTKVSPACFNVLGFTQEELVGQPLANIYKVEQHMQQSLDMISAAAGKPAQTEGEMIHKNGSSVWIMAHSSIRYGPDGLPVWRDGVVRDISERKLMEEQLAALARTDSLTGTYSRRHFLELSEELFRLVKRHQRPISMMMADLDHFKKINDAHGHHGGDQALVAFAETCRKVIRESDLLGRMGGEEFCLVLPETPLQQARVLAERLREATANLAVPLHDRHISLTVSIGLVELGGNEASLESMMRRADLALYRAKAEGRNRVACA